jgi:hypothetical protein
MNGVVVLNATGVVDQDSTQRGRDSDAYSKKNFSALKHGGYSAAALLPGENPAALKKLHDDLIAELSPVGALEEDIVASITRLVWRKRHLATSRVDGSVRDEKKMTTRVVDDIDPDKARKEYEAFCKGMRRESLSSEEKEDMKSYCDRYQEALKQ